MPVSPLRAAQPAAELGGALHRDFYRWLNLLLAQSNRNVMPIGAILGAKLSAADVALYFSSGLGIAGERWEGWAICDGANGTPNLDGKWVRYETTESGGSGNVEETGSGAFYELVPVMRVT